MSVLRLCLVGLLLPLLAQDSDSRLKIKALRDWAKEGSPAIEKVAPYLIDADVEVRREAVRALVTIGTQRSLDPLIRALGDEDPEVQIRATDGIVNFYFPGYVERGLSAQLRRAGALIPSVFRDQNEQVVDPDVIVREEIVQALGGLLSKSATAGVRANAARALGILRGRSASPALLDALKSKDDGIMYEALIALQKIGDRSNGPGLVFLTRDLNSKIQLAAIETAGLLRTPEAVASLRRVLENPRDRKTRREAFLALARIADASSRDLLLAGLEDKDEEIRAAAAEGLGRLGNRDDQSRLEGFYRQEGRWSPRLAAAFALAQLGDRETGEAAPLRYLVNALNQKAWKGVAQAYLGELCRQEPVRQAIYPLLESGATKDEKTGVAQALGTSGGSDAAAPLERLTRDTDLDVSREALRQLRILRTQLSATR
jgi:HEAT repeat protein